MVKKNDSVFFENKLLDFVTAKDPMLEMLQWVMAKFYEKIRDNHRIVSKAVMVIKAVNLEGQQEILAVETMGNESEETYSAHLRKVQERGLEKVWQCVTDAHNGFQAAIRDTLPGTT